MKTKTTSSLRRVTTILTFSAAVAAAGCDGCSEILSPIDDDGRTPLTPDGDGDDLKEPRQIALDGQSPVIIYRGATSQLRFVVTGERTGAAIKDEAVTVDSTGFGAAVVGSSFVTDVTGGVFVPVRADADGTLTVTASITDVSGTVESASAEVRVVEDPAATLRVSVASTTRIPVATASASVFVAAGAPDCATLMAQQTLPQSTFGATFSAVPQTQTFANQPTGRRATAIVFGHNAAGAVIAKGCGELARLDGGVANNTISVTLEQGPTSITGDYDVLMSAALGQALPEPYDSGIDIISGLLANPAGYALFFIMQEADLLDPGTTLETVADDASFGSVWDSLQLALNNQLRGTFGPSGCTSATGNNPCRYDQVRAVGSALRDVVTDFEIGARFEITESAPGVYQVEERWNDAVVEWPLPCANGDTGCARRAISMDTVQTGALAAVYPADIAYAPLGTDTERFTVAAGAHGFDLNYGALLLAILNQVVFPSLPITFDPDGAGPQAPRPPRSIREVLGGLVNCQAVAASITGSNSGGAASFINFACDAGLGLAATFAENQLTALRVDASNPQLGEEGLQATGSFVLSDADRDTEVETLKDFNFQLGWYFPENPSQSEDISSPIRGAGGRVRAACDNDDTCAANQVCRPVGSYLKIAAVEQVCAPRLGSLVGGASCSADNQCASGLCDPVGLSGALVCCEACNTVADCSTGLTCTDDASLVDLNPILPGLGEVLTGGCAAP